VFKSIKFPRCIRLAITISLHQSITCLYWFCAQNVFPSVLPVGTMSREYLSELPRSLAPSLHNTGAQIGQIAVWGIMLALGCHTTTFSQTVVLWYCGISASNPYFHTEPSVSICIVSSISSCMLSLSTRWMCYFSEGSMNNHEDAERNRAKADFKNTPTPSSRLRVSSA